MNWTHEKLVRRMGMWLKNTKRMTVVITELRTRNTETPDVIGWIGGAWSTLIECKVSRADFKADAHKSFRYYAEQGMGDCRYMAAPVGLLEPDEMPEGWGLLEVGRVVKLRKEAEHFDSNKSNECVVLMSALRRLELSTAVYVVHCAADLETKESDDAT